MALGLNYNYLKGFFAPKALIFGVYGHSGLGSPQTLSPIDNPTSAKADVTNNTKLQEPGAE